MDIQLLVKNTIDKRFLNDKNTLEIISSENYMKVLKENQNKIIEIDRDYIQKFVKIGGYLKSTQQNIFNIFERILKDEFRTILDLSEFGVPTTSEFVPLLSIVKYVNEMCGLGLKEAHNLVYNNKELIIKEGVLDVDNINGINDYQPTLLELNQHIISYQSLVISSFKMIKSLNEDDMITFYEMYEVFDKLGIFDTQWQKSMLEKIGDLTSSIEDVSTSLKNVNTSIKNGLDNLSDDLMGVSVEISSGFDTISSDINNL
tara:strand:+ start:499 stop:1275 length:777 start_codon:yes stop_codon:yes gene_type:complete